MFIFTNLFRDINITILRNRYIWMGGKGASPSLPWQIIAIYKEREETITQNNNFNKTYFWLLFYHFDAIELLFILKIIEKTLIQHRIFERINYFMVK